MEQMSAGPGATIGAPKIITPAQPIVATHPASLPINPSLNPAGKPVIVPQIVGGELQLPSKVLYLQNVPKGATEERITDFFRPDHTVGLVEVRLVPTRHDLAFVEFADENHASNARQALDGALMGDVPVKVSFAKR